MVLLLGLSAGTLLLYLVFCQISEYNKLICDKYKYRYYAIRDRLALLVMRGELEEDSWEYEHIIDTINFHIQAVERVSLFRLAVLLIQYHASDEEQDEVRVLSQRVNPVVAEILADYLEVTSQLLLRNSRAQIRLAKLFRRIRASERPEWLNFLAAHLNPIPVLELLSRQGDQFRQKAAVTRAH